jgi:hypothetical protein
MFLQESSYNRKAPLSRRGWRYLRLGQRSYDQATWCGGFDSPTEALALKCDALRNRGSDYLCSYWEEVIR